MIILGYIGLKNISRKQNVTDSFNTFNVGARLLNTQDS